MIKFSKLKVDTENKKLLIYAAIDDEETLYDDFYISSVKVVNQRTFNGSVPEGESTTQYYYIYTPDTEVRYVDLTGDNAISLNTATAPEFSETDLFFVYITINSSSSEALAALETAGCGADILTTVGVAYNKQYLYNEALNHINLLSKNCNMSNSLIDWILSHKYFELSVKGGRFFNAINLWNTITKRGSNVTVNCGCNG